MSDRKQIITNFLTIIREDKKNVSYLLYYAALQSILVLTIPLASSFIINSILSHAAISILVLALIVISIFIFVTFVKIIQEYIVEKFQQKLFVTASIKIAELAANLKRDTAHIRNKVDRNMNYFFDITSIQKAFPVILLDGTGLVRECKTNCVNPPSAYKSLRIF
jgi:ABC-type bacteriocin/lantibiotic exporter with double-glycine peptidase domain